MLSVNPSQGLDDNRSGKKRITSLHTQTSPLTVSDVNLAIERLGRSRSTPVAEPSPLQEPIKRARNAVEREPRDFSLQYEEAAFIHLNPQPSSSLTSSLETGALLHPPLPLPAVLSVKSRVNHPLRIASPPAADSQQSTTIGSSASAEPSVDHAPLRSPSPLLSNLSNQVDDLTLSASSARSSSPHVVTPPRAFKSPPGAVLGMPIHSMRSTVLLAEHTYRDLLSAVPVREPDITPPRV